MAFLGEEEQLRELHSRFRYLYAAIFISTVVLMARLIYLQVLSGDKMRQFSEENRIKRVKITAPRGMIFDRNRVLLIDNRPAFDLEIIPQYLMESKQAEEVLRRLSKIIKSSPTELRAILNKNKDQPAFMPVKIKTDLSRDEVAVLKAWQIDMPGVSVQMEIKRTNVFRDVASQQLGYIGEVNPTDISVLNRDNQKKKYKLGDVVGKAGLERQMENTLRGNDGEKMVEVDALGRVKLEQSRKNRILAEADIRPEIPGRNLILTIDQDLQEEAVKAFGDKVGGLVAIDPRNGEILAMISRPSYDPTAFSRGISPQLWNQLVNDENRPLRDKTIQDHYPPGSIFKTVTAITALEEGAIDEKFTVRCTGSLRVGNRIYHCHKKQGHGEVNVVSALTKSCDVFFYKVATQVKSVNDIAKWALHLGLGKKTGIPLAQEVPGLIPTEEWKQKRFGQIWSLGETLSVAIGQSFVLTTVLQIANLYASIANGGTFYKPYIVKRIESFEGTVIDEFQPKIIDQTRLQDKTNTLVKRGLWGVVNNPNGTAYRQHTPALEFSGKTGTSQVIQISKEKIYQKCQNLPYEDRHHGFFAGFAPSDNPVIAVAVIAEHSCSGSGGAAPIARAVIESYSRKYYPALWKEDPKIRAMKEAVKPSEDEVTEDSNVVLPESPSPLGDETE